MTAPPARLTVLRSLGFFATSAIIICNMVGQGVFLKARVMTCNVGTPVLMIAAWIVAGLLSLCGALTFAELGAALPESGGIYVFLRRAYGRAIAFAYGWMNLLVGGPASTAALAVGSAIFFNLSSGRALERLSVSTHVLGVPLSFSGLQIGAIVMIVAVTAINFAPARANGRIATGFAVLKIVILVLVTLAAFTLGRGSAANYLMSGATGACADVASGVRGGLPGFAAALIGAFYAYGGWQSVTLVAGEVKNPGRALPTALGIGVTLVIGLYVAANLAFVFVLGPREIANLPPGASVGITTAQTLFGPAWKGIAAALLFASVAATLHVTILTVSRVTYAVANDGVGFAMLGRLSKRARVPVNALLANGAVAVVLVILGSFDTLSDYYVFNSWMFFVATAGAAAVLRRREPQLVRPYRTVGYPIVPGIFIAIVSWVLLQTLMSSPRNAFIGLVIVALSFPVYYWRSRRAGKS